MRMRLDDVLMLAVAERLMEMGQVVAAAVVAGAVLSVRLFPRRSR